MARIHSSKITPEHFYFSRRKFVSGLAAVAAGALLLPGCRAGSTPPVPGAGFCDGATAGAAADELGAALTPCDDVISYNNFYEFSLDKEDVGFAAREFVTSPWNVTVGGLVGKPRTFGLEDLLKGFPQEERIYRMRCVEGWSMVIPWLGFPLAQLLKQVEPLSRARYVRFETLLDPKRMPGQTFGALDWPYVEGLRLDEAMHNLTIVATGLYGKPLPPQNGAPVRLVVPWKYGFKNIKSIVKIDLVEAMPVSSWSAEAPHEYGFYASVNPEVSHPRWSQASERRIGDPRLAGGRMRTLLFNGYGKEVSPLYEGLDLAKNY
ncbi:MAG: protein-methionine-sulfoxide reductase catalytic subunit MsrP [Chloroflexi bacterium]|nr:protein-methionine-sulfoxide reductase catalytic subunit MsrP [Chloroflexota bacterium]